MLDDLYVRNNNVCTWNLKSQYNWHKTIWKKTIWPFDILPKNIPSIFTMSLCDSYFCKFSSILRKSWRVVFHLMKLKWRLRETALPRGFNITLCKILFYLNLDSRRACEDIYNGDSFIIWSMVGSIVDRYSCIILSFALIVVRANGAYELRNISTSLINRGT